MFSSTSTSTSTPSLSVRTLLISTIVLSTATAIKLSFPLILTFLTHHVPVIWSVILSWLTPPYLYVVINGIIITIVASSRFQHHHNHNHYDDLNESNMLVQPSFSALEHLPVVYETENMESEGRDLVVYEVEPPVIDVVEDEGHEDKFVVSGSTWNSSPLLIESFPVEKVAVREMPLVSSRFAHQRRTAKINPEGVRSLRVTKPKKHETLESTWKMITDGRHIPLNRHRRKSDNYDDHHHHHTPPSDVYPNEQVGTDYTVKHSLPPSGGKLRKEGSLSHDELNRRVEAFIKKFNEEMRLQRQESLQRYMDMINRGV